MTLTWYKIINLDDFEATGLVSKTVTLTIGFGGTKNILVTKGNLVSILFQGSFLAVELNDKNPFDMDNRLCFLDENNDIWLGLLT